MIRVESAQQILIGLACATRMFDRHEPRNQTQHLRWTSLRLEQIFFVRKELLGRRGDWPRPDDGHLRHIDDFDVRIVREGRGNND
jgi:hypothetical protein